MSSRQCAIHDSDVWLFHQAQAECQRDLNVLMDHHQGLVQAVVRRQVLGDLPFTEALQVGRIGEFHDGVFPTEGGLRYWLTTLGEHAISDATVQVDIPDADAPRDVAVHHLNQLIAQSVTLMVTHGLLSQEAWEQALVCPDGLLHHAASRLRCPAVQASCYYGYHPGRSASMSGSGQAASRV